MCYPKYYQVKYQINPWMQPDAVDFPLALKQWQNLYDAYQQLDVQIEVIDQIPSLPDMVFSTDAALVAQQRALIANFKYPERQTESTIYAVWYQNHHYSVDFLPKNIKLEGGDVLRIANHYFLGTGFRSTKKAADYLEKFVQQPVQTLELINPFFYHLDTCLFSLNDEVAFFYSPAFSAASIEKLKKFLKYLYPLSLAEVEQFVTNSVVTDHHVVMQKNYTPLRQKIEDLGYQVVALDVSEFIKAGGGIKCLTGILEERYE